MIWSRHIVWGQTRRYLDAGYARIRHLRFINSWAHEHLLLVAFALIFFVGIFVMGYERYLAQTISIPEKGGHYIEGIVGNRSQLKEVVTRLTFAGLVSIDSLRKVIPVLAKEWAITPDGKTYTFTLYPGVDSNQIATTLKEDALFKTVEFETPDPQTLIARLKQPFGPFLFLLALPLFPYGPFQVEEEAEDHIVFVANPTFPHGTNLTRITVRVYPDGKSLQRAVTQREVFGAATDESINGWQRFEAELPRSIMLILNTTQPGLQNPVVRSRLLYGEQFSEPVTLTLVTTPQLKSHADQTIEKWRQQNVNVELKLIEDATMRESIIPKREYDALIYGVDFGIEPDPFRFWHSSQATDAGLNMAQLKESTLDAMLEEARKIVDDGQRFTKYAEIERKIDELAVRSVLQRMTTIYQISPKIKGVEQPFMVNAASRYNLVWKWYTYERREFRKTESGAQKTD